MRGTVTTEEKVAQLKQDTDIQKALDQAATPTEPISVPAKKQQSFSSSAIS